MILAFYWHHRLRFSNSSKLDCIRLARWFNPCSSKSETRVSVLWLGNGHVFPIFGLEMDEKSGVLVWKWSRFPEFWFGNGWKTGRFGLEMVTFFPNFGLEMDEKPGVLVWKWLRFSQFLVWKWMKNRAFLWGKVHIKSVWEKNEESLLVISYFPHFG